MAFMYWGGLIMLFFNIKIALIIFLYRIIVENITISYSRSRFGFTKEMLRFYPIWLVIQNFFLVLTMVLGQFNIFVWKGKRPTSKRNNNANHNI